MIVDAHPKAFTVPWIVPAAVMRAPMTSATTPPIRMVRTAVQSWKSLASHVITPKAKSTDPKIRTAKIRCGSDGAP